MDPDVMARPPRKAKDPMISLPFLLQIFATAMIIVAGTLYVFWKEVGGAGQRVKVMMLCYADGGHADHAT